MSEQKDREFTVTVSRIATANLVYAIRQPAKGKPVLYKVLTKVIDRFPDGIDQLRVDMMLKVTVDPKVPGHVVSARVIGASHESPIKSATRKELAARAQR